MSQPSQPYLGPNSNLKPRDRNILITPRDKPLPAKKNDDQHPIRKHRGFDIDHRTLQMIIGHRRGSLEHDSERNEQEEGQEQCGIYQVRCVWMDNART